MGNDDNVADDDELLKLAEFNNDFKHQRLKKITNKVAQNMLSQLLVKDPTKRFSVLNLTKLLLFSSFIIIYSIILHMML
jgi:hypothetical protein